MDTLETYRQSIKKVLKEYHDWVSDSDREPDESLLIFDENRDQYIWMHVGWDGKRRTHRIHVHVRLKNDKIWIEEDSTEEGIATELMKQGITPKEIVLAFHHPQERSLTDFAVA